MGPLSTYKYTPTCILVLCPEITRSPAVSKFLTNNRICKLATFKGKIAQPANIDIWAKFNNDYVIPGNRNLMLLPIANPAGSSILNPTALMKFLNNF